jgi:hypothetical protein
MPKPPRQLTHQVEIFEGVIKSLNDLTDVNKIQMQYYGADFIEPLTDLRTKALELRNAIEVFKNNLEFSLGSQYLSNSRFASTLRVIDNYLSSSED